MITPAELAAEAEAAYKKAYVPTGNALVDHHLRLSFLLGFAQGGAYYAKVSNSMIQSQLNLMKIKLECK